MTFHVPNPYRIRSGPFGSDDSVGQCGAFWIPNRYRRDMPLTVIASDGNAGELLWEHVSVSYPDRCPTWEEMCLVKSIFWDDEDAVMQLHPPQSDWVNNHGHCLHLWRPTGAVPIPLPPAWMVGDAKLGRLA